MIIDTTLDCVSAQMYFWPGSRILSWHAFTTECLSRWPDSTNMDGSPIDWNERIARYREAYPHAVPYETAAPSKYLGIRYGAEGSQYISGFPGV